MGALNVGVDVMLSPEAESHILKVFEESGMSHKILIEDVQSLIDNENPSTGNSMQRVEEGTSLNWTAYHRLDDARNTHKIRHLSFISNLHFDEHDLDGLTFLDLRLARRISGDLSKLG